MKTYFECVPCFIRQALDAAKMVTADKEIQEQVLREALGIAYRLDLRKSPPAMAQEIHRRIKELTGDEDPYVRIKDRFNKLALGLYPEMKDRIESSADPLETAVRLAIAGNIIDFGVSAVLAEERVDEVIEESLLDNCELKALEEFRSALAVAQKILYLGDNAGEIVFDRLLVEQLPMDRVTFVVKGKPIINDATMEDAEIVGLTDIVEVTDNGSDAPGTILESCSEEFRRRFDEADLVIAKGQGNYETLSDEEKNIFFILRTKCDVIAKHLKCDVGSLVLVRNGSFENEVSERSNHGATR